MEMHASGVVWDIGAVDGRGMQNFAPNSSQVT
jgi:hypothetical protein